MENKKLELALELYLKSELGENLEELSDDIESTRLMRDLFNMVQINKVYLQKSSFVYKRITDFLLKIRGASPKGGTDNNRSCDMVMMLLNGETLGQIATTYDLSQERVRQIVYRSLDWVCEYFETNECLHNQLKEQRELVESLKSDVCVKDFIISELKKKIKDEEFEINIEKTTPIREVGLSGRAINGLLAMGVTSIEECVSIPRRDMLRYRNMGQKTIKEIEDKLAELNISFKK